MARQLPRRLRLNDVLDVEAYVRTAVGRVGASPEDFDELVSAWPPLKDEDVARMIRNLNVLGWVQLEPSDDLPVPGEVYVDEFELQEA
jgi:hypothetical protein